MSKLILALLLAVFAVVNFSRAGGATNYREYKKFDLSAPTQRVPSKCRGNLKEHPYYYYRDKCWEFLRRN
jgi:hypothetical protein